MPQPKLQVPAPRASRIPASLSRWGLAVLVICAGIVTRQALEPLLGGRHTYTVFYPCVIVAAYFLGTGPAALVAGLSAMVATLWFADERGAGELATLIFFGATSAVSIYFITGMRRALAELARSRARAEMLAASHAELFHNLNERVTNHLQLVAALLQLQARDAKDRTFGRALSEASARTLLISRAHRQLAGEEVAALDFDTFARQLLDTTLAAWGATEVKVDLEPTGVSLPPDHATSVAIVLLERLQARLQDASPATLKVGLRAVAQEARLTVTETGVEAGRISELRPYLVEAMVEQLGGRYSCKADADGVVTELAFPMATVGGTAPAPTLH